MTNEENLRQILNISEKDALILRPLERKTRNPNFILLINNEPTYFIKNHIINGAKEKIVYEFLEESPVVTSIKPVYIDDSVIITPYLSGLSDCDIENNLEFILQFHTNLLNLSPERYSPFSNNSQFKNNTVENFRDLVRNNQNLIPTFWENINKLNNFAERYSIDFGNFPKTFCHGDIHPRNLQIDKDGNIYLVDFENSCYDFPSWDLARALLELNPQKRDSFIEEYVKRLNFKDKVILTRRINKDYVLAAITHIIKRQRKLGVEDSRSYIKDFKSRCFDKMEEILNNKDN